MQYMKNVATGKAAKQEIYRHPAYKNRQRLGNLSTILKEKYGQNTSIRFEYDETTIEKLGTEYIIKKTAEFLKYKGEDVQIEQGEIQPDEDNQAIARFNYWLQGYKYGFRGKTSSQIKQGLTTTIGTYVKQFKSENILYQRTEDVLDFIAKETKFKLDRVKENEMIGYGGTGTVCYFRAE